jgi:hypothetical protein
MLKQKDTKWKKSGLCSLFSVLFAGAAFAADPAAPEVARVGMQNQRGMAAAPKMVAAVTSEELAETEAARVGATSAVAISASGNPFGAGARAGFKPTLRAAGIELAPPAAPENPAEKACKAMGANAKWEDKKCMVKVAAYNGDTALGSETFIAAGTEFNCGAELFGITAGGVPARAEVKVSGDMDGRENNIKAKCSVESEWVSVSVYDASDGLVKAMTDAVNNDPDCQKLVAAEAAGRTLKLAAAKGGARGNRIKYDVAIVIGVHASAENANGYLSGGQSGDEMQCRIGDGTEKVYFGDTGTIKSVE